MRRSKANAKRKGVKKNAKLRPLFGLFAQVRAAYALRNDPFEGHAAFRAYIELLRTIVGALNDPDAEVRVYVMRFLAGCKLDPAHVWSKLQIALWQAPSLSEKAQILTAMIHINEPFLMRPCAALVEQMLQDRRADIWAVGRLGLSLLQRDKASGLLVTLRLGQWEALLEHRELIDELSVSEDPFAAEIGQRAGRELVTVAEYYDEDGDCQVTAFEEAAVEV